MLGDCEDFPAALSACRSYGCEFTHPLTQETLKRDVVGLISGKCKYIETMPEG